MSKWLTPDAMFRTYDEITPAYLRSLGVRAVLAADLRGVVLQGTIPSIEIDLSHEELDAPVIRGTPLGVARLISGGEVIAEVPLLAGADVPRDDFPAHWRRIWENWLMVENAPVTNGV